MSNSPQISERLRVVVIEPRRELGFVTKRYLEFHGHEVHCATDGREGVELVATLAPEVVTSSIDVPGLDGFQIAREITTRLQRKPRLVATTSYSKAEIGERLKKAGFDCYLAKPYLREQLVCAVEAKSKEEIPEELLL